MRTEPHPCYILHLRPYRETSLLAELLSSEHGRVSVVARGARRNGNRQRHLFRPLLRVHAGWHARGELGTLTAIEAAGRPESWPGEALIAALYLNELLVRLLHRHESHPELFTAYEQALAGLCERGTREAALRIFEKRLLQALGYGLVLDREADGGARIEDEREYYYVVESGPRTEPGAGCRVSGATLNALHSESLRDATQLQQAKRLLRSIIGPHLGTRPLASRDLYRRYLQTVS